MGFKQARKRAGLTLIAAGEKLGISASAISQWETGQSFPSTERLPQIAALYGCTVDELLREPEPEGKE